MLPVTKIQHFCTKDGPGIRTTVFLKDCPLRCIWCHNPETQTASPPFFYTDHLCIRCGGCAQVCPKAVHRITKTGHLLDRTACTHCMRCVKLCPTGALEACVQMLSPEEILREVLQDHAFYGTTGGVTFSGGEPTVHADQLIPLLRTFKEHGIHTAIETCGYFDPGILPALTAVTDLFLWDIKDTDDTRHFTNTGVSNRRILDNLKRADTLGAQTVLRCILLKSVNLNTAHLQALISLYQTLTHCVGVELIPYHTYGVSKNRQLGKNGIAHKEWIPSTEELHQAEDFLQQYVPILHN